MEVMFGFFKTLLLNKTLKELQSLSNQEFSRQMESDTVYISNLAALDEKKCGCYHYHLFPNLKLESVKLVSTDMPANPSEVLVIDDKRARPAHIAADLLSQAEHGPDSQVVLVIAEDGVDVGPSRRRSACSVRVFLEEMLQNAGVSDVDLLIMVDADEIPSGEMV
ncbi:hypothetical protein MKW98_023035 [Papaver atlanticum]|uniref:Uncharacterized protein n=1 Tax=Papaver atlanticum TaxID=357466 RepID=A0AAD4XT95_9MAGN|nr:hypothetical protein MKW98_023035 [Papaver atlanticum]